MVVTGNLFIIKPDSDLFKPKFLYNYFLSEFGRKQMGRFASGTTVPSISFGDLKKQRIPKRNFQEQKNVIKQFDQIDEMIDELQKKLIEMKKKREELNSLFQYK